MAFLKRTWLARIGTGLNKFIIGNKDGEGKQTLTNAPDSVTQQGDVISAENLNDLEDRIEAGFNEKQDVLTFDNVPTEDSDNPVKSGGVYTAMQSKSNLLLTRSLSNSGSRQFALNAVTTIDIDASYSGYELLGVIAWKLYVGGSSATQIEVQGVTISGNTITGTVVGRSSVPSATLYIEAVALYIKS